MLFRATLFLSALIAGAAASNVVELTPSNFDEIIGKGKPALVEFFAPWCGHCKNLAPIYEQLADSYAHAKDKVIIAKVDADGEGKPLGKKYGVTGYPTLKWFDGEGNTEDKYQGGRDLDSLATFILRKTGVKSNIPAPPPTDVNILTYHDFDEVALDKSKNVIVAFTAPWCGHCKALKPIYEKIATTFKPESDCVIANFDADDIKHRNIAVRYGISGFPTIKFFSKDNKEPVDYEGDRDEASIVKYLNEKCGTQRAVGGGLNDDAGRIPTLDTIAHKFFNTEASARDTLYSEAVKLAADVAAATSAGAKHYIRVMEKVKTGTQGYVDKEIKRLEGILAKRSLGQSKLDELKIKLNILNSFQKDRAQEKEAQEKETIQRADAEL